MVDIFLTFKPITMGMQKTTKLTPYSRGTKQKIELERQKLALNADIAKTERVIKQRHRAKAMDAQTLRRATKPEFDWNAYYNRPKYVPQVGAPGFNNF